MKKKQIKLKNILIVRPDAIGDVTLMIPMINTLKATYPKAKITVLLQRYTAPLLENHPHVDALMIDKKKEGKCRSIKEFISYVKEIKAHQFDAVIFSYLDMFYALLMVFSRIPIRVGDGQKIIIKQLLTHPINQYFRRLAIHETEQNIQLLKALGPSLTINTKMNLKCDSHADKSVKILLEEFKCKIGEYIIIHPATGGGNKPWLPEKYAELINLIHDKTNLNVIITGFGDKERNINQSIIKDCKKKPLNCFERTSLQELKSLIKYSKLIIGTDTGPTHMAAALKVSVICISPTKFVKSLRWGPWETKNKIVGQPQKCNLICNPYICDKTYCLDSISVESVFEALIKIEHETFSRKKMKHEWLLASVNIGLVISNQNDLKFIEELIPIYKQAPFRLYFLTHSSEIKKVLKKTFPSIKAIQFSYYLFPSLIREISKKDITIIHLFSSYKKGFWKLLIRQLSAPFMYCPPLIMRVEKVPKKPSQLIDLYLKAFSQKA